jgi:hypothetical protein
MDFSVNDQLNESSAAFRRLQVARAFAPAPKAVGETTSTQTAVAVLPEKTSEKGTRVVSEKNETIENGLRRTRTFEQDNGRQFTRVEELLATSRGSKKSVVQQNPSGSITRYEEILDRDDSGTFRRTQRFQDEAGEQVTQITYSYNPKDPFSLTSGGALSFNAPSPFESARGTQLDLSV